MEKDIVTIDTRNTFIAVRTIKLDIKEGVMLCITLMDYISFLTPLSLTPL